MADNQQNQQGPGSNLQVIVPIIVAAIGVIGTIFANWDKIFPKKEPQPSPSTSSQAASTPSPSKSENLVVYARSPQGTRYINKENGYVMVTFEVEANNKWLAIPDIPKNKSIRADAKDYISAKGAPDFPSNKTPCVRYPLGALIVKGEDQQCKGYGVKDSFELKPGETVYFKMNDVPGMYDDNQGELHVRLSIAKQ